jgi:hypothetical protein
MEHLLPRSPYTSHYETWSPYHEHGPEYAGGSYITADNHHVDGEQANYQVCSSLKCNLCAILTNLAVQPLQYGRFHPQNYVIAQNEVVQHAHLNSPDSSVSYWPTTQVPTTMTTAVANGPPLSAFPMDPMYYSSSCNGNQNLPRTDHRHAPTEDYFQPGLASACAGTAAYGTAGLMYSDANATFATSSHAPTLPALVQNSVIAHQNESGHDRVPQDANARPAWYEVSAHQHSVGDDPRSQDSACQGNATFSSPDSSYTQFGPVVDPFNNTVAGRHQHQHYTPPMAREDQQLPYVAASSPAADTQNQYIASTSTPARSKPKTMTSEAVWLPRARSPMGHLPYPEEVAAAKAKAEGQHRPSSAPSAQSSSPASTPLPLTPVQQTLTFITYPETEPRTQHDSRGGSGAESDDPWDEDDSSSPSRRGRRGKKQPKKDPSLACFFCRGRKIACHPKNEGGEDRTCA